MLRIFAISVIIFLILIPPLFADELFFKNGDIITGKLIKLEDEKITFETENMGMITVDISKVKTLSTDDRMEIHLKSGDVIFVAMGAVDGGFFAPESPEARIYSASDILSINRMEDCGPLPPEDMQSASLEQKRKTSGHLNADATLKPGTSVENISTGVNLDITRETGSNKISAAIGYLYGEQIDKIAQMTTPTQDSVYAVGKYDFCLRKKPFGYVSTRFESDRIADLDSRISTSTGINYDVIRKPDFKLNVKSDAEVQYEKYGQNDTTDLSASLGWNLQKKFSKKLMFVHELKYVPENRNFSDLFLTTNAELRSNLTKSLFWNLKVAMDYDSTIEDTDKANMTYTLGIGWDLF